MACSTHAISSLAVAHHYGGDGWVELAQIADKYQNSKPVNGHQSQLNTDVHRSVNTNPNLTYT